MEVEVDCDSEFENDYFIDEEVSKSDTEADEDIDEYQTTVTKMFGGAHLLAEEEEESESENEPIACATKVKKEVKNNNPIELAKEKEEESEDELLLTTKTNKQLQKEITIQQTKKTFKECKICAFS